VIGAALLSLAFASPAHAQLLKDEHPAEGLGVDVVEKRGEQIPLDLTFTDSEGREASLAEYFDGERPVCLILGYYDCPLLCVRIFNGAQEGFNDLGFTLGKEFRALSVSIDHTNTASIAAGKQAAMLAGYNRMPGGEDPWPFLVGDASSARELADGVGFQYRFLPKSGEFSHPAVMIVLTPDGVVSNYLYGVSFPARQVRLALLDASEGRIGSLFDKVLLFCHIYDPASGAYSLQAFRVMQVGATLTVVVLAAFIGGLFLTDRLRKRRRQAEGERATARGGALSGGSLGA